MDGREVVHCRHLNRRKAELDVLGMIWEGVLLRESSYIRRRCVASLLEAIGRDVLGLRIGVSRLRCRAWKDLERGWQGGLLQRWWREAYRRGQGFVMRVGDLIRSVRELRDEACRGSDGRSCVVTLMRTVCD